MTTQSQHPSKKMRNIAILLSLSFAGVFLFHKPLLLTGCKGLLKMSVPQTPGREVVYERMEWEGDAIVLSGLHIKESVSNVYVDRIEIRLKPDLLHFCLR